MLKGVTEENHQKQIMRIFIDEVNEMFIWLAKHKTEGSDVFTFPNLYHVDNRGVARNFDDWFDEIHLKSDRFEVVANAYKYIIFGDELNSDFDKNIKVIESKTFG